MSSYYLLFSISNLDYPMIQTMPKIFKFGFTTNRSHQMFGVCALVAVFTATGCIRVAKTATRHETNASHTHFANQTQSIGAPLKLTYQVEGSNAIFDSDKVTLVFVDVPPDKSKLFFFQHGIHTIQVEGSGQSKTKVDCQRNKETATFASNYKNGTNILRFCEREVKLTQAGTSVVPTETITVVNDAKLVAYIRRSK